MIIADILPNDRIFPHPYRSRKNTMQLTAQTYIWHTYYL